MPDIRSPVKLNSKPMSGIYGSGATIYAYHAACTANLTSFSSYTLIPGVTASVVIPASGGAGATIIAIVTLDQQINVSGGSTITYEFFWNGTAQPITPLFEWPLSTSLRMTNGNTFIVSGIGAGTYNAQVQAYCSSGGTIRTTHTNMTILVIG